MRLRVIWDFQPEGVGLLEVDYKTEDLAGMFSYKYRVAR